MNLQNFIKQQEFLMRSFEKWWEKNHKLDPKAYPETMIGQEWDEHFKIFIEGDIV